VSALRLHMLRFIGGSERLKTGGTASAETSAPPRLCGEFRPTAYRQCLCHELQLRGLAFVTERPLPVIYKGLRLDCGYRVDLIVAEAVVVELKTVDRLAPVHDAQLLTYLRLGGWKLGLLINFNVALLRDGIHRRVLGLEE